MKLISEEREILGKLNDKGNMNIQKFNYHTHTRRCGHADNNMTDEDFVKLFIQKGFTRIAFADHCPQKEIIDFRKNIRMEYSEKDEYLKSIKAIIEIQRMQRTICKTL